MIGDERQAVIMVSTPMLPVPSFNLSGHPKPGTFRAHCVAIRPELVRRAEISAAGQTTCTARSAWSKRLLHRTRPTGRLTPITCR